MLLMMETLDDIPLGDILEDGAYDTLDCPQAVHDRGGKGVYF